MKTNQKIIKRKRRHARVRARVDGTATRPRLSVFRSNRFIYAQIIDDNSGKTLVSVSSEKSSKKEKKTVSAKNAGKELAKVAKDKKISTVVFDRGGYLYTGRVKELAEGAREGGLDF